MRPVGQPGAPQMRPVGQPGMRPVGQPGVQQMRPGPVSIPQIQPIKMQAVERQPLTSLNVGPPGIRLPEQQQIRRPPGPEGPLNPPMTYTAKTTKTVGEVPASRPDAVVVSISNGYFIYLLTILMARLRVVSGAPIFLIYLL